MIGSAGNEVFDEIRSVVDATFAEVTRSDPWLRAHPPVIEWTAFRNHGAEAATDAPIVRLMSRAWRDVTGTPAVVDGLSAVTDMRHLVRLGKIPTVNVGPGDMRAGHTGDEALPLDEFVIAVEVYAFAAALWGTGTVA
jgi:acetylornithine deacetylase